MIRRSWWYTAVLELCGRSKPDATRKFQGIANRGAPDVVPLQLVPDLEQVYAEVCKRILFLMIANQLSDKYVALDVQYNSMKS